MAVEFAKVAEAPVPMAVALRPVAVAPSPKAAPPFAALAAAPTATEPVATAPLPIAMELTPLATAFVPTAVAFAPLAWAFTPHPNDDAAAEAPLLLPVTELTTGINVGVTDVRMFDFVTVSPWTTFGITCGVTLVTALPVVELKVVAFVKKGPPVIGLIAVTIFWVDTVPFAICTFVRPGGLRTCTVFEPPPPGVEKFGPEDAGTKSGVGLGLVVI